MIRTGKKLSRFDVLYIVETDKAIGNSVAIQKRAI